MKSDQSAMSLFPLHLRLEFVLLAVMSVVSEDEEFTGRTFELNRLRLSRDEAARACQERGGRLAKIRTVSTIPNLGLHGNWVFWIGLVKDSKGNWTWPDNSSLAWSNWLFGGRGDSVNDDFPCAVAQTAVQYFWQTWDCRKPMPSLCELAGGECRFNLTEFASIISRNRKFRGQINHSECRALCLSETDFLCRSYLYNEDKRFCQWNEDDRYSPGARFVSSDSEYDYYHRTCDIGRIKEGYTEIPISSTTPMTSITPSSTVVPSTTTAPQILSSSSESLFCTILKSYDPNVTEPEPEEVKELRSINVVLKQRQVTLKRISIPDYRPSASYVGSTAVIIAFSLVGSVLICDLATFVRFLVKKYRTIQKRKGKEEKNEESREVIHIADHMQAVNRHMQIISETNMVDKQTRTPKDISDDDTLPDSLGDTLGADLGDNMANAEVLSEHSFSKIMNTDLEDGKLGNGHVSRDSARTYDWSKEDSVETRDISDIDVKCDDDNVDGGKDSSLNSGKYMYRPYVGTRL